MFVTFLVIFQLKGSSKTKLLSFLLFILLKKEPFTNVSTICQDDAFILKCKNPVSLFNNQKSFFQNSNPPENSSVFPLFILTHRQKYSASIPNKKSMASSKHYQSDKLDSPYLYLNKMFSFKVFPLIESRMRYIPIHARFLIWIVFDITINQFVTDVDTCFYCLLINRPKSPFLLKTSSL